MHIVISTKSFMPILGGSIIYAAMLAEYFSSAGHRVTVITRTLGRDIPEIKYHLVRKPTLAEKMRIASSADALLQIESSWRDAYPFLIYGVPWFPTVHRGRRTMSGLSAYAKLKVIVETLAYRIGRTIGVSTYVTEAWGLKEPAIPNPYDEKIFHEPAPGEIRNIDILFVGSIVRHKGIFVLIEALKSLTTQLNAPPLNVAFVGEGPDLDKLRCVITELTDNIKVVVAGRLDRLDVADWMKRSRILAFPTTPDWLEASPLTPLEGAACGCLIVASDSGGTRENISPSHWIVKPGSSIDLSRALSEALERPDEPIDPPTRLLLDERRIELVTSAYLSRLDSNLRQRNPSRQPI